MCCCNYIDNILVFHVFGTIQVCNNSVTIVYSLTLPSVCTMQIISNEYVMPACITMFFYIIITFNLFKYENLKIMTCVIHY